MIVAALKAIFGALLLAVNILLPLLAAAVIGWTAYNLFPRRRVRAYWRLYRRHRSRMNRRLNEAAARDSEES